MLRHIILRSYCLAAPVFLLTACYDQLHIEGDTPSDYAWVRVYVADEESNRVYRGNPPTDAVDWRDPDPGQGIPVGGDLVAIVDSLRGFEVYAQTRTAPPRAVSEAYIHVPGITQLRVLSPFTVEVDNLADTVLLDLSSLPALREVERRGSATPHTPGPTSPPSPTAAESSGHIDAVTSDYFECPDVERKGRFLGWRLKLADAKTLPLCTRD